MRNIMINIRKYMTFNENPWTVLFAICDIRNITLSKDCLYVWKCGLSFAFFMKIYEMIVKIEI